jgi:hypothetical protein
MKRAASSISLRIGTRAAALILVLSLLGGCGTSTSVRSAGSENGQHGRLVFGLPF